MTPEELHNIFRSEERLWWYQGMRAIVQALLDPLPRPSEGPGLDAGCGTGFNALAIESRYGLSMFGVDAAPLALQYGRSRNFQRGACASVDYLPFPDNCFDLVCSLDVLSHLAEGRDRKALSEFARVLVPGGSLLLRVPAFHALRSRHSQYIAETRRYRASELAAMFREQVFLPVRSTYAMTLLSPVSLFKFRVWEPLLGKTPSSGVAAVPRRGINHLLTRVLLFEAALIRRGVRLPFGQSCIVVGRKQDSHSSSARVSRSSGEGA